MTNMTNMTETETHPYAPDWKIYRAIRTTDRVYKWHVIGWNRNTNEEICWSVPELCWRYDLSDAVIVESGASTLYGTGANGWARTAE